MTKSAETLGNTAFGSGISKKKKQQQTILVRQRSVVVYKKDQLRCSYFTAGLADCVDPDQMPHVRYLKTISDSAHW